MSINNSLSLIKLETLPPKKNWNHFGKVLKCQTPSGRASLTLYKPSHKIRHCQGTYCVHFSLFYSNVQFCTLLKLYINVHWVSSGKKIQGFQTSQFSTIVALLLKFQTFKSSEVKIGGSSKEKKFNLSSVNIVTGIFKHSNHLRLKICDRGKLNILTFICDVLWIPNIAESFW